jgi:hypothetical protein
LIRKRFSEKIRQEMKEMDLKITFDSKEVVEIIREKLATLFPGITFKISAGSYYSDWTAESVDPVKEAASAKLLAEYLGSIKHPEPSLQPDNNVTLDPADVAILQKLQGEADAL